MQTKSIGILPKKVKAAMEYDITLKNVYLHSSDRVDTVMCYMYHPDKGDAFIMGRTYKDNKYTEYKLAFKDEQTAELVCKTLNWKIIWDNE